MQEVMATIKFRTFSPIACLSRMMLFLKRVSLIAPRRVWGRTTYLSSTSHLELRHLTKMKRLDTKLIINRPFPEVMPSQMIDVLISSWSLFNKWNQFNRRYADLPESLNHRPEFFSLENTNNARKWDVTRAKSGQLRRELLLLRYPTPRTITLHVLQKLKPLTAYHNPTDTPCLPTRTDGWPPCKSKWIL